MTIDTGYIDVCQYAAVSLDLEFAGDVALVAGQ
jgi:hypothetical protein